MPVRYCFFYEVDQNCKKKKKSHTNMERQARSSPWALVELGKGIPIFLSSVGASNKKKVTLSHKVHMTI